MNNSRPLRSRRRTATMDDDVTPLSYSNMFYGTTDVINLDDRHSFGEICLPIELAGRTKSDVPRIQALYLFNGSDPQWLYMNKGLKHTRGSYVCPVNTGKPKFSGMTTFAQIHRVDTDKYNVTLPIAATRPDAIEDSDDEGPSPLGSPPPAPTIAIEVPLADTSTRKEPISRTEEPIMVPVPKVGVTTPDEPLTLPEETFTAP